MEFRSFMRFIESVEPLRIKYIFLLLYENRL